MRLARAHVVPAAGLASPADVRRRRRGSDAE